MRLIVFFAVLGVAGCTCDSGVDRLRFACDSQEECGPGYSCRQGECTPDAPPDDGGDSSDAGAADGGQATDGGFDCLACDGFRSNGCSATGCTCGTGPACGSGQQCVNGACACNASSCPSGCCSGASCLPGDQSGACGTGGLACQQCPSPQTCAAGTCSGCSASNCPNGCCANGACVTSLSLSRCATGGAVCTGCDPRKADTCASGSCRCGTSGACGTGQECMGGTCVGSSDPGVKCGASFCTPGTQVCCDPGGTPTCSPATTTCSGGALWCADAADCGGQLCCGRLKLSDGTFHKAQCNTSCLSSDVLLCDPAAASPCANGKSCLAWSLVPGTFACQ